jgi:hypothetical protein
MIDSCWLLRYLGHEKREWNVEVGFSLKNYRICRPGLQVDNTGCGAVN